MELWTNIRVWDIIDILIVSYRIIRSTSIFWLAFFYYDGGSRENVTELGRRIPYDKLFSHCLQRPCLSWLRLRPRITSEAMELEPSWECRQSFITYEEVAMEPVVGIDVAKKFSVVQAFTKRNEPFGKPLTLSHEEGGFEQLGELLAELQAKTNMTRLLSWNQQGITMGHLSPISIAANGPILSLTRYRHIGQDELICAR